MAEDFDSLYDDVVGDDADDMGYGPDELTAEELEPAPAEETEEALTQAQEAEKAEESRLGAERIRGESLGMLNPEDVKKLTTDRREVAMHRGDLTPERALETVTALLARKDIPGSVSMALEAIKSDLSLPLDPSNELLTEAAVATAIIAHRVDAQDLRELPVDPLPTTNWSTDAEGHTVRTVRDAHGRVATEVFAAPTVEEIEAFGDDLDRGRRGETGAFDNLANARDVTRADLLAASPAEFLAFQKNYPDVVQGFLDEESEAMDATHRARGF